MDSGSVYFNIAEDMLEILAKWNVIDRDRFYIPDTSIMANYLEILDRMGAGKPKADCLGYGPYGFNYFLIHGDNNFN